MFIQKITNMHEIHNGVISVFEKTKIIFSTMKGLNTVESLSAGAA
jgi:hypothetical protein